MDLPLSYESVFFNTPITLTFVNGVSLKLLLPSCSSSYIQEEWVTLHHPVNHTRLYLNIKYMFLSSIHTEENESLLQSFQQQEMDSGLYLRLFSPPPVTEDEKSVEYEKHGSDPFEMENGVFLSALCVPGLAFFLYLWFLTARFPISLRVVMLPLISTAVFLLYPYCVFTGFLHPRCHLLSSVWDCGWAHLRSRSPRLRRCRRRNLICWDRFQFVL